LACELPVLIVSVRKNGGASSVWFSMIKPGKDWAPWSRATHQGPMPAARAIAARRRRRAVGMAVMT
jgi:hypothetical protein